MAESTASEWQAAFMQTVQKYDNAIALKDAAMDERLGDWTKELTASWLQPAIPWAGRRLQ